MPPRSSLKRKRMILAYNGEAAIQRGGDGGGGWEQLDHICTQEAVREQERC